MRNNYLNLSDITLKFELIFGAFCIAAIILVILCCLTTIKLCECHSRNRRNRRGGSSVGKNKKKYIHFFNLMFVFRFCKSIFY